VQKRLIPEEPPTVRLQGRTYIYLREDGKAVHCNAIGGFIGDEYEHDDPNWQPPNDWPYEVVDYRQERR
jgi:hypothetical protein